MRNIKERSGVARLAAFGSTLLLAGAVLAMTAGPSMATKAIAKKEGKKCEACHSDPPEKALNAAGQKYKAQNGL